MLLNISESIVQTPSLTCYIKFCARAEEFSGSHSVLFSDKKRTLCEQLVSSMLILYRWKKLKYEF